MIRYKRTKKIIIAINNITLKKSLMYSMDGKNFIYGTFPTATLELPALCRRATCNNTMAKITKGKINVERKIC
jgi:hypothetical protein